MIVGDQDADQSADTPASLGKWLRIGILFHVKPFPEKKPIKAFASPNKTSRWRNLELIAPLVYALRNIRAE